MIAEQACFAYSLITVPLYDTLGPDASNDIVNETQLSLIFCSKARVEQAIDIAINSPYIKYIVQFENGMPSYSSIEVCQILISIYNSPFSYYTLLYYNNW